MVDTTRARCVRDLSLYKAACVSIEGREWDAQGVAESIYLRVNRGFKALNDIERQIVIGRYIDGLNWDDIAYKVYYSERWCRAVRNKAMEKLCLAMYNCW